MTDMSADDEWIYGAELAAMIAEFDVHGTCTCPRCGRKSQPWAGMWYCECGAAAINDRAPKKAQA